MLGGVCRIDNDCSEGTCENQKCTLVASKLLGPNSLCNLNTQCRSLNCQKSTDMFNFLSYCTKSGLNGMCMNSDDCSQGGCFNNVCSFASSGSCSLDTDCETGKCQSGKCATSCSSNSDCVSGVCQSGICDLSGPKGNCNTNSDCQTSDPPLACIYAHITGSSWG